MSAPRLLHMGGVVADFVYRIADLPAPGMERIARAFDVLAGGGFNMMFAARRCGMRVAFGGGHGTGPYGTMLRQALAEEGIACLRPPMLRIDSGTCVVLVTDDAERTFVSWPGAEGQADAAELAAIRPGRDDWVFVSGYTLSYPGSGPPLAGWVSALPEGTRIVFDPGPVVGVIPPDLRTAVLNRATWVSLNGTEAAEITGHADPDTQAGALLQTHCPAAQGIVIRMGASGALLSERGVRAVFCPADRVEAVDTNGAGDTHGGAFIAALARGERPEAAVRYANAAAALSVTRKGGAAAPFHDEIITFLQRPEADGPAPPTKVLSRRS